MDTEVPRNRSYFVSVRLHFARLLYLRRRQSQFAPLVNPALFGRSDPLGLVVEALIATRDTHIRHRHRNCAGGCFSDGPDTNDGLLGLHTYFSVSHPPNVVLGSLYMGDTRTRGAPMPQKYQDRTGEIRLPRLLQ